MTNAVHHEEPGAAASMLGEALKRRIREHGPMTVADYMEACLADPKHGYYRNRDPLGASGDFTTAPEVSQMFGELIGLWCVTVWRSMGAPVPVALIELGPGRGTLMADALRAAQVVPQFLRAVRLHLVESSPVLRARQAETLQSAVVTPSWHDELAQVPPGPALIVANEFFDALPVRQFVHHGGGWRERLVGLDAAGRLAFCLSQDAPEPEALPPGLPARPADGTVAERCPAAEGIVAAIAARAGVQPLAALLIDYGYGGGCGDTLQAVRRHRYADPLAEPGRADITAHVDFAALARVARAHGVNAWGPISQARFLLSLGLAHRAERLMRDNPEHASDIAAAACRLVEAEQMGELFKAMALTSPRLAAPPPFAECLT